MHATRESVEDVRSHGTRKMKHFLTKSIANVMRLGESKGQDMPYIVHRHEMVIWIDSVCHRVTWVEVMIWICHGLFLG